MMGLRYSVDGREFLERRRRADILEAEEVE